jgi:LiaI-LiaF-like transmembrane region
MNKIALAVVMILFGLLLLLKNSNLLPDSFCSIYLHLAENYWPSLIILFGLQLLVKDRYKILSRILGWLILILLGLWLFCHLAGANNWIT